MARIWGDWGRFASWRSVSSFALSAEIESHLPVSGRATDDAESEAGDKVKPVTDGLITEDSSDIDTEIEQTKLEADEVTEAKYYDEEEFEYDEAVESEINEANELASDEVTESDVSTNDDLESAETHEHVSDEATEPNFSGDEDDETGESGTSDSTNPYILRDYLQDKITALLPNLPTERHNAIITFHLKRHYQPVAMYAKQSRSSILAPQPLAHAVARHSHAIYHRIRRNYRAAPVCCRKAGPD